MDNHRRGHTGDHLDVHQDRQTLLHADDGRGQADHRMDQVPSLDPCVRLHIVQDPL